ncbi:MAG: hypothetical protein H6983_02420 [Ectothiorhodospiraceae bacterium]|nr:hypothetical protein [Ectothiorhodospiraceae bacterium]
MRTDDPSRGPTSPGVEHTAELKSQVLAVTADPASAELGGGLDRPVGALLTIDDDALIAADPVHARHILDAAAGAAQIGAFAHAERLLLKGLNVLLRHPLATEREPIVPMVNLALVYDAAGHAEPRDRAANAAVAHAAGLTEPLDGPTAHALLALVGHFERAGDRERLVGVYRAVHPYVLSLVSIDPNVRLATTGKYIQALTAAGRFADAADAIGTALEAVALDASATARWRLRLLLECATAADRAGDAATAVDALRRGRDVALDSVHADSDLAGILYHNLAGHYLRRGAADELAEARDLMTRSLGIVRHNGRTASAEYAGGHGQLAAILDALGEETAATEAYAECVRLFDALQGPERERARGEHAAFLRDAGLFHVRRASAPAAIPLLTRALALRRELSPGDTTAVADALSDLATAHFESGDLAAAARLHRAAIDTRNPALGLGSGAG